MPHLQRPPQRALRLAAAAAVLFFFPFPASASAIYIRGDLVFPRADAAEVCGGDANLSACAQTGLPDNFCCTKGTNCMALAGDTTVLCCPEGSTCDSISPIVCDLSLQDASKNPNAAIKTTVLGGKLESCGSQCCPYGYSCDNGECTLNKDQSKKPAGASGSSTTKTPPKTSSSSSPSSTSGAASKPTTTGSKGEVGTAEPSPGGDEAAKSAPFPTSTVVGGVVGGLAALIGITVLVMLFRYKRQQAALKQNPHPRHDSSSSFGNIISAPQPLTGYANTRQDFLAKATTTSSSPTISPTSQRFPHRYSNSNPFASSATSPQQQPYYANFHSEMAERPYPPIQNANAAFSPRSHHPSAEIGGLGLRDLTTGVYNRYSQAAEISNGGGGGLQVPPMTPLRERRRPSAESGENINIFADPSTVGSGSSNGGYGGGGGFRGTTYTTWTNIMADGESTPGLPDTPTTRRR